MPSTDSLDNLAAPALTWSWWQHPAARRWGSVLVLFLLSILAVLPGYLPGRTLAPTAALRQTSPWGDSSAPAADQDYRLQLTAQVLAPQRLAIEQLKDHDIPLWNPHQFLGQPLLGSGQIAPFYPAILLHALPPTWSYALIASVQLFIAGLGAWLLAGRLGLPPLPALLSGCIYLLCGLHLAGLHTNAANASPWLPYVLLLLNNLLQSLTAPRLVLLIAVLAIQFLAGDPVASTTIIITALLFLLIQLALPPQPSTWRTWLGHGRRIVAVFASLLLALVIALALAGVQWAPVIDAFRHTIANPRFQHPAYLPWGLSLRASNPLAPAFVGSITLILSILALLLSPRRRFLLVWSILAAALFVLAVAFPWLPAALRAWADLSFVGPALLLLTPALALALLAGAGLEALGEQLAGQPDLPRLRLASLLSAALIGLIVLLWIAFAAITRRALPAVPWGLLGLRLLLIVTVLALAGGLWFGAFRRRLSANSESDTAPASASPRLALLTLLLVIIELLAFALPHNRGSRASDFFPDTAALQALQARPAPFRFAASPGVMPPNLATAYALDDLRGLSPRLSPRLLPWLDDLQLKPTADLPLRLLGLRYLLLSKTQPPPSPAWKSLGEFDHATLYENPDALGRAWLTARTQAKKPTTNESRALPTPDQVFAQLHAPWNFDPRDTVLVDGQVDPSLALQIEADAQWKDWPDRAGGGLGKGTLRVESQSPDETLVEIRNSAGGWLVFAQQYFPGWEAWVTAANPPRPAPPAAPGTPERRSRRAAVTVVRQLPLVPAFATLQAIPVSPGNVDVELRYRPWGWRYGLFASSLGLLALLLVMGIGLFHLAPAALAASDEDEDQTPDPPAAPPE